MTRILALLAAVLALQHAGVAAEADDWGKPADGLKLAAALIAEAGSDTQIRIAVRSVSDEPLLLPFGYMIGDKFNTLRIHVVVATPAGQQRFRLSPSVQVGGRVELLAIPMVPNGSYTIQIPIEEVFTDRLDDPELLPLILQPGQLWVEWEGGPGHDHDRRIPFNCPVLDAPNPNIIRCWENTMVSNTLQLPR
jgi:hypothetical protein